MDETTVQAACEGFSWRSWKESLAELAAMVHSDPSTFWLLGRDLIEQASSPIEAEEYSPGLLALLSLDEAWEAQVVEAARASAKIATALAHSFDVLAPRTVYDLLGRDFVVQTWVANNCAWGTRVGDEMPWEFWAWDLVDSSTSWGTPEEQWDLVLALVGATDTDDSLYAVAARPLEDFVQHDWRFALEVIEPEVRHNVALRQALGGVNLQLDLPSDVERRFRALGVSSES